MLCYEKGKLPMLSDTNVVPGECIRVRRCVPLNMYWEMYERGYAVHQHDSVPLPSGKAFSVL